MSGTKRKRRSKKKKTEQKRYLLKTVILGITAAALFGGYDYYRNGNVDHALQAAAQVWEAVGAEPQKIAGIELPGAASVELPGAASAESQSAASAESQSAASVTYSVSMDQIPEYTGESYVTVDGNIPQFSDEERNAEVFENYSDLDSLGRCGAAEAMICTELMPTEERGAIGMVKPSGWHTVKYDNIDGKYLYNRCHLIGYQLAGENANEKNLITGTRYLNVTGMLPWENLIAEYVKRTDDKVLYRVTPVYEGDNLVASGVQMEAESLGSDEISFNVFVFNIQPGIEIDYSTGESQKIG
jgi:DNA-entry nuclease